MDDLERSNGAWLVAEERARAKGAPLPRRGATAAPTAQASLGLPNRIERLKRIEAAVDQLHRRLRDAWTSLAVECSDDPPAFAQRWAQRLDRWSFLEHDELVDEHNEWFPIEAQLRWDLELEDFRAPFGLPWRKTHVNRDVVRAAYPPDLDTALAASRAGQRA